MKELKCESHVKQKIQEKFWTVTIISAHSVLDLPGQVLYLLPESHCSSLGGGEGVSFPHFKAEQKGNLCFSKPEMGSPGFPVSRFRAKTQVFLAPRPMLVSPLSSWSAEWKSEDVP